MNLSELKHKPIGELLEMTEALGLDNLARSRKNDIIFALLKKHAKGGEDIYGDGVLEILPDGFGFLRSAGASYLAGADDIYVSPSNMELILDRKIAEKRVYPAINVRRSGTRREDLLIEESELQRIWILRKLLHDMEDLGAAEFVVEKLKGFKNNAEFFVAMKRK